MESIETIIIQKNKIVIDGKLFNRMVKEIKYQPLHDIDLITFTCYVKGENGKIVIKDDVAVVENVNFKIPRT